VVVVKMFTLTINRYGRYLSFDTLEELKDELRTYFSQKEIASGIVERLTNFSNVQKKDGYKKISYQDYTICSYE
jgi:hypothetical protein